jgi:micrococcal nuclease
MYTYKAKIDRVIDGDTFESTIDLGFGVSVRKMVRLAGVDTPEKNSKILLERDLASRATARAKNFLENRTVTVKTELDKDDKYGRVLAYVYESDREFQANQSYNLKLIQDGLANPYFGGKKNV